MAVDTYRSPVRYPVRATSPVRIAGSTDAPFRVINLGAATVWVSDNSGIVAGAGTPIYAGTSLQWIKPTQLFAVANTGTTSEVLVTTEIDDWTGDPIALAAATASAILNSGVVIIDQPTVLYNDQLRPANSRTTPPLDISRYQSVTVSLECVSITGTNPFVRISFYADAAKTLLLKTFAIPFHSAGIPSGFWKATLPVQGAFMVVEADYPPVTGTGPNVNVIIVGSNRPQERIDQQVFSQVPGGADQTDRSVDMFWESQQPYVPGTNTRVTTTPWIGQIEITARLVTPAVATPTLGEPAILVAQWYEISQAFNAFTTMVGTVYGPAPPSARTLLFHDVFSMNGEPLQVTINNTYAVNMTNTSLRVTPVIGTQGL